MQQTFSTGQLSAFIIQLVTWQVLTRKKMDDTVGYYCYLKKIVGVFRVKNHDFTPKIIFFSNFRGARAGCAPPLGSAPGSYITIVANSVVHFFAG
jgi:hypothetical protein